MRRLKKLISLWKNGGVRCVVSAVVSFFGRRMTSEHAMYLHRRRLAGEINSLFGSTVAYGPFRGLTFSTTNNLWGDERGAMILGLYEQEILDTLVGIPRDKYKVFVDLGAADGYYAIGSLVAEMFDEAYAFEASEDRRKVISENAMLNGVAGRIHIRGAADRNFYKLIPSNALAASVILVDIEGEEFSLFDRELFGALRNSIVIIELHDDSEDKLAVLRDSAAEFFNVYEMTTTVRDMSKFDELRKFSDTDRWLLCSEGRPERMTWFRLDPKCAPKLAIASTAREVGRF
jgi:hypothetical protein